MNRSPSQPKVHYYDNAGLALCFQFKLIFQKNKTLLYYIKKSFLVYKASKSIHKISKNLNIEKSNEVISKDNLNRVVNEYF